jgi:hypothetical protein
MDTICNLDIVSTRETPCPYLKLRPTFHRIASHITDCSITNYTLLWKMYKRTHFKPHVKKNIQDEERQMNLDTGLGIWISLY